MAAASGPQAFALVQEFLISPLGLLLLFGWTLALFYHFWSRPCGIWPGMRGIGFAQANLNPVTWGVLALTLVLSTGMRCGPWPMRGWEARRHG